MAGRTFCWEHANDSVESIAQSEGGDRQEGFSTSKWKTPVSEEA